MKESKLTDVQSCTFKVTWSIRDQAFKKEV